MQTIAITTGGTLYALNEGGELRQLRGNAGWKTLDTGVQSFVLTAGDVLYEVNGRHQFKRLTGRHHWQVLEDHVQSLSSAPDGTIYVLSDRHELMRLEADGRLSVVDVGVLSYHFTPNGDLYELNDRRELKRLKLGYSWSTLASGVRSFTSDPRGTVFAIDDLNRIWAYGSLDRYYILPELRPGGPQEALDPPSDFESMYSAAMWDIANGQGRLILPDALPNDVQYFAPGPEFPLSNELAALMSNSVSLAGSSVPSANEIQSVPADDETASAGGVFYYPSFLERFFVREPGEIAPWSRVRIVKDKIVDRIDPPRATFPTSAWPKCTMRNTGSPSTRRLTLRTRHLLWTAR